MKETTALYTAIDAVLDVAEERDRETVIDTLDILFRRLDGARLVESREYSGKREV